MPIPQKLFWKREEESILSNSFYEVNIILIQNQTNTLQWRGNLFFKFNQQNVPYQQMEMKLKENMILIQLVKAFDKNSHQNSNRIEGNFLNMIKSIYEKTIYS